MATNDWRKFLVPEKELLIPPRMPSGIYSYGPEELHLRENIIIGGGPEEFVKNNTQLFATSSTSNYEGYAYWALLKIIGEEGQPGKNGAIWYYQSKVAPNGRAGSAIVDFVVEGILIGWDIGIRITSYFHTDLGSAKSAFDFDQAVFLLDQGIYPVDADGERIISDDTGTAAIIVMQESIDVQPDLSSMF
jgi:hypothetical protein